MWCVPCRVELPELQRLFEARLRDGLVVVAVNVDSAGLERAKNDRDGR